MSTVNAHYTSPAIVQAMWDGLAAFGFAGGRVLEPGCGSGNFIGLAPRGTAMVGIELDPVTASIARALYPHAQVRCEDFARTQDLRPGSFDAAIGNVPFGGMHKRDPKYNPLRQDPIHTHFIHKAADLTAPGGLVAMITSRYTLDGSGQDAVEARRRIARLGELVAAVRLPSNAHRRTAGTTVVTDVLVLRRFADGEEPPVADPAWVHTGTIEVSGQPVEISRHFIDNPGMILGDLALGGAHRADDLQVNAGPGDNVAAGLAACLAAAAAAREAGPVEEAEPVPARELPEGTQSAHPDGTFTRIVRGTPEPFTPPGKPAELEELRALLGLRDTALSLLDAEMATSLDEGPVDDLRAELNARYDAYLARFGPVNRYTPQVRLAATAAGRRLREQMLADGRAVLEGGTVRVTDPEARKELIRAGHASEAEDGALRFRQTRKARAARQRLLDQGRAVRDGASLKVTGPGRAWVTENLEDLDDAVIVARIPPRQGGFRDDPCAARVLALEKYDQAAGTTTKRDIMQHRVLQPRPLITSVSDPKDAVAISMDRHGEVRLPEITALLGAASQGHARARLGTLVYPDPAAGGQLVPAPLYLSGNIRVKLRQAQAAASAHPEYEPNVEALKRVIPPDKGPEQIAARLGAVFITRDNVEEFLRDILDDESLTVQHEPGQEWQVTGNARTVAATLTWGTSDRSALSLAENALNRGAPVTITRTIDHKQVVDAEATAAARDKQQELADRFSGWVWEDLDRANEICRRYNETFNAKVLRSYDEEGAQLTLPGLNRDIALFWWQKAGIARMIHEPSSLIGHDMGLGKTLVQIIGTMEQKRLGLIRKPVFVVKNNLLEQFRNEFIWAYPQARVLCADSPDLAGDGRRHFLARAAAETPDAIIMTQRGFEAIPLTPQGHRDYIAFMEDQYRAALDAKDTSVKDRETSMTELSEYLSAYFDPKYINAKKEADDARDGVTRQRSKSRVDQDPAVSWEHMGADAILADESQEYMNLFVPSDEPGMGIGFTHKAIDLHMKTWTMQRQHGERGLTFASGTAVTNKIAQYWNLYMFLRPGRLKEAGFDSFTTWAATFTETEQRLEMKADGTFGLVTRHKLINLPEFLADLHDFCDFKDADRVGIPRPGIRGGKPELNGNPGPPELYDYYKTLPPRYRAARTGKKHKGDDTVVTVLGDGFRAAQDLRLLGTPAHGPAPAPASEPQKLDYLADDIYQEWLAQRQEYPGADGQPDPIKGSLQLVFCNEGTPKRGGRWNMYDELRDLLAERGMPRRLIRFMHEAGNDANKKQRLFDEANAGYIAVLISSTEKGGVGVNVQRRAIGVHHVHPHWRPDYAMQEDARARRLGNLNPEVFIKHWLTERSFDMTRTQTAERKAVFLKIMKIIDPSILTAEVPGDDEETWATMNAISSGEPRLYEKARLETEVRSLARQERRHHANQNALVVAEQRARKAITEAEQMLRDIDAAVPRIVTTRGDAFTMTVAGTLYDRRKQAGDHLLSWVDTRRRRYPQGAPEPVKAGELGGFDLMVTFRDPLRYLGDDVALTLKDLPGGTVSYGHSNLPAAVPLLTGLERRLAALGELRRETEATISLQAKEAARACGGQDKPFPHREALAAARSALERLIAELRTDNPDAAAAADQPAPAGPDAGEAARAADAGPAGSEAEAHPGAPHADGSRGREQAPAGTTAGPAGDSDEWTSQHPHAAVIAVLRGALAASEDLRRTAAANSLDRFEIVFRDRLLDQVAGITEGEGTVPPFAAQLLDDPSFSADLTSTLARQVYPVLGGTVTGPRPDAPDAAAVRAAAASHGQRIQQNRTAACSCSGGCSNCLLPPGQRPGLLLATETDMHLARAGIGRPSRILGWDETAGTYTVTVTSPGGQWSLIPPTGDRPWQVTSPAGAATALAADNPASCARAFLEGPHTGTWEAAHPHAAAIASLRATLLATPDLGRAAGNMTPERFTEAIAFTLASWSGRAGGAGDPLTAQFLDDPSFAAGLTAALARQAYARLQPGQPAPTDEQLLPVTLTAAATAWSARTQEARTGACDCQLGCGRCRVPAGHERALLQVTETDIHLARAGIAPRDRALTWNDAAGTYTLSVTGPAGQQELAPSGGSRLRLTRGDGSEHSLPGTPAAAARDYLAKFHAGPGSSPRPAPADAEPAARPGETSGSRDPGQDHQRDPAPAGAEPATGSPPTRETLGTQPGGPAPAAPAASDDKAANPPARAGGDLPFLQGLAGRHGLATQAGSWNADYSICRERPADYEIVRIERPGGPLLDKNGRVIPDDHADAYLAAYASGRAAGDPDALYTLAVAATPGGSDAEKSFATTWSDRARHSAEMRARLTRAAAYIYGDGRALVVTSTPPGDRPHFAFSDGQWAGTEGTFPLEDEMPPLPIHLTAITTEPPRLHRSAPAPEPAWNPGETRPAAPGGIVIEHGQGGTAVRGTDRSDTALTAALNRARFDSTSAGKLWYLPGRTSYDNRDRKVRRLLAELERLGRPAPAVIDRPLPAGTSAAEPLPRADPYPELAAVTAGIKLVLSRYSDMAHGNTSSRLLHGETRDDVTALKAAGETLRAFLYDGPPGEAHGNLPATLDYLADILETCARTAQDLQHNLDAQKRRAPRLRPLIDSYASTALEAAARMAAMSAASTTDHGRDQAPEQPPALQPEPEPEPGPAPGPAAGTDQPASADQGAADTPAGAFTSADLLELAARYGMDTQQAGGAVAVSAGNGPRRRIVLRNSRDGGPLLNEPGRIIAPALADAYFAAFAEAPGTPADDLYAQLVPGTGHGEHAFAAFHSGRSDASLRASEHDRDHYLWPDGRSAVTASHPPASGAAYYRVTSSGQWFRHLGGQVEPIPAPPRDLTLNAGDTAASGAGQRAEAGSPPPARGIDPIARPHDTSATPGGTAAAQGQPAPSAPGEDDEDLPPHGRFPDQLAAIVTAALAAPAIAGSARNNDDQNFGTTFTMWARHWLNSTGVEALLAAHAAGTEAPAWARAFVEDEEVINAVTDAASGRVRQQASAGPGAGQPQPATVSQDAPGPYGDGDDLVAARIAVHQALEHWKQQVPAAERGAASLRFRDAVQDAFAHPLASDLEMQRQKWADAADAAGQALEEASAGRADDSPLPAVARAVAAHSARLSAYHAMASEQAAPYPDADAFLDGAAAAEAAKLAWLGTATGTMLRNLTDHEVPGSHLSDLRRAHRRTVDKFYTMGAFAPGPDDPELSRASAANSKAAAAASYTLQLTVRGSDYQDPADRQLLRDMTLAAAVHAARVTATRDAGHAAAIADAIPAARTARAAAADAGRGQPGRQQPGDQAAGKPAGDAGTDAAAGLVLEHGDGGTKLLGVTGGPGDDNLRRRIRKLGFKPSRDRSYWFLPRPWKRETRNWKVSQLKQALTDMNRPCTERDNRAAWEDDDPGMPAIEPGEPYSSGNQAIRGIRNITAAYHEVTDTPAGKRIFVYATAGKMRSDAAELKAAMAALRDPAGAEADRSVSGLADVVTRVAAAAHALHRHLLIDKQKGDVFLPRLQALTDTARETAGRLAATSAALAERGMTRLGEAASGQPAAQPAAPAPEPAPIPALRASPDPGSPGSPGHPSLWDEPPGEPRPSAAPEPDGLPAPTAGDPTVAAPEPAAITPPNLGYIALYGGKRTEIYADSLYAAKEQAVAFFTPPRSKRHLVTVHLAEKNGEQARYSMTSPGPGSSSPSHSPGEPAGLTGPGAATPAGTSPPAGIPELATAVPADAEALLSQLNAGQAARDAVSAAADAGLRLTLTAASPGSELRIIALTGPDSLAGSVHLSASTGEFLTGNITVPSAGGGLATKTWDDPGQFRAELLGIRARNDNSVSPPAQGQEPGTGTRAAVGPAGSQEPEPPATAIPVQDQQVAPGGIATCAACGTSMKLLEDGQRYHPMCEPEPDASDAQARAGSAAAAGSLPGAGAAPAGSAETASTAGVAGPRPGPAADDNPAPGRPASPAEDVSDLVPPLVAAQAAARHAARVGRTCYVHRAPAPGSLSHRMIGTAVPPLAAGYLAVTPDGTWTEHWRGQERPLEVAGGEPAPDYPITLTEARTLAAATGLEAVITRVGERAFISLAEPGAAGAPLLSFEVGSREVFAGRAVVTASQAIDWLGDYRRAMDSHAAEANGPAYTTGPGVDEWARRIAHLAPHLVPGPDYRRRVWETLATAVTFARRGDADAARGLLGRAETEAAPLVLSSAREAALIRKINEDAPRWHQLGTDAARYIANREADDLDARATQREEGWIRQYIAGHPGVLAGRIVTSGQLRAAAEAQREHDVRTAADLVGQIGAAAGEGRLGEALALVDDAELCVPDAPPVIARTRAMITAAAGHPAPAQASAETGAAAAEPRQDAAGPAADQMQAMMSALASTGHLITAHIGAPAGVAAAHGGDDSASSPSAEGATAPAPQAAPAAREEARAAAPAGGPEETAPAPEGEWQAGELFTIDRDAVRLDALFNRQRATLEAALAAALAGDPDRVLTACRNAISQWNLPGNRWPADAGPWQRALASAGFTVLLEDLTSPGTSAGAAPARPETTAKALPGQGTAPVGPGAGPPPPGQAGAPEPWAKRFARALVTSGMLEVKDSYVPDDGAHANLEVVTGAAREHQVGDAQLRIFRQAVTESLQRRAAALQLNTVPPVTDPDAPGPAAGALIAAAAGQAPQPLAAGKSGAPAAARRVMPSKTTHDFDKLFTAQRAQLEAAVASGRRANVVETCREHIGTWTGTGNRWPADPGLWQEALDHFLPEDAPAEDRILLEDLTPPGPPKDIPDVEQPALLDLEGPEPDAAPQREAARTAAQASYTRHKRALAKAIRSGDPDNLVLKCHAAVTEWIREEYPWPDNWSDWQRALDDALRPRGRHIDLDYLATWTLSPEGTLLPPAPAPLTNTDVAAAVQQATGPGTATAAAIAEFITRHTPPGSGTARDLGDPGNVTAWDELGLRRTVAAAPPGRDGTLSWEQVSAWLGAGMTSGDLQVLQAAGDLIADCGSWAELARAEGLQDVCDDLTRGAAAVIRDCVTGVTTAAAAIHGPGEPVPADLPRDDSVRGPQDTALTAGQADTLVAIRELAALAEQVSSTLRAPATDGRPGETPAAAALFGPDGADPAATLPAPAPESPAPLPPAPAPQQGPDGGLAPGAAAGAGPAAGTARQAASPAAEVTSGKADMTPDSGPDDPEARPGPAGTAAAAAGSPERTSASPGTAGSNQARPAAAETKPRSARSRRAPLTHADVATALRRLAPDQVAAIITADGANPGFNFLSTAFTRHPGEPDEGSSENITWTAGGADIEVITPHVIRKDHVTWPKLVAWLSAGATPGRRELLLQASHAWRAYEFLARCCALPDQQEELRAAAGEAGPVAHHAARALIDAARAERGDGPLPRQVTAVKARPGAGAPLFDDMGEGSSAEPASLARMAELCSVLPAWPPRWDKPLPEVTPGDILRGDHLGHPGSLLVVTAPPRPAASGRTRPGEERTEIDGLVNGQQDRPDTWAHVHGGTPVVSIIPRGGPLTGRVPAAGAPQQDQGRGAQPPDPSPPAAPRPGDLAVRHDRQLRRFIRSRHQLHAALERIAGQSPGFTADDAYLGHLLAGTPPALWGIGISPEHPPPEGTAAWLMLAAYRDQLELAGIRYEDLPVPPGAETLPPARVPGIRAQAQSRALTAGRRHPPGQACVRCDGPGQPVILQPGPQDDAAGAQRAAAEGAARDISGWQRDPASGTFTFPPASLPAVVDLAGRHGIMVPPEVRALAGLMRPAGAAGQGAPGPATRPPAPAGTGSEPLLPGGGPAAEPGGAAGPSLPREGPVPAAPPLPGRVTAEPSGQLPDAQQHDPEVPAVWMTREEIGRAAGEHLDHPVLGPATRTISNLASWAEAASTGWRKGQPPALAASQLMELVANPRPGITGQDVLRACAPLQEFRAEHGIPGFIEYPAGTAPPEDPAEKLAASQRTALQAARAGQSPAVRRWQVAMAVHNAARQWLEARLACPDDWASELEDALAEATPGAGRVSFDELTSIVTGAPGRASRADPGLLSAVDAGVPASRLLGLATGLGLTPAAAPASGGFSVVRLGEPGVTPVSGTLHIAEGASSNVTAQLSLGAGEPQVSIEGVPEIMTALVTAPRAALPAAAGPAAEPATQTVTASPADGSQATPPGDSQQSPAQDSKGDDMPELNQATPVTPGTGPQAFAGAGEAATGPGRPGSLGQAAAPQAGPAAGTRAAPPEPGGAARLPRRGAALPVAAAVAGEPWHPRPEELWPGSPPDDRAHMFPAGIRPLPGLAVAGNGRRQGRVLHPPGTLVDVFVPGEFGPGSHWRGVTVGVTEASMTRLGWLQAVRRADDGFLEPVHPALLAPAGTDPYAAAGTDLKQRIRFQVFDAAEAAGLDAARQYATNVVPGDRIRIYPGPGLSDDHAADNPAAAEIMEVTGVRRLARSVEVTALRAGGGELTLPSYTHGTPVEVLLPQWHPAQDGPGAHRFFGSPRHLPAAAPASNASPASTAAEGPAAPGDGQGPQGTRSGAGPLHPVGAAGDNPGADDAPTLPDLPPVGDASPDPRERLQQLAAVMRRDAWGMAQRCADYAAELEAIEAGLSGPPGSTAPGSGHRGDPGWLAAEQEAGRVQRDWRNAARHAGPVRGTPAWQAATSLISRARRIAQRGWRGEPRFQAGQAGLARWNRAWAGICGIASELAGTLMTSMPAGSLAWRAAEQAHRSATQGLARAAGFLPPGQSLPPGSYSPPPGSASRPSPWQEAAAAAASPGTGQVPVSQSFPGTMPPPRNPADAPPLHRADRHRRTAPAPAHARGRRSA